MTTIEFCEKYDITRTSFYVFKSKHPEAVKLEEDGRTLIIDEEWFLRRKKFQEKVRAFNIEVYYLLTEHMSVLEMIRLMNDDDNIRLRMFMYDTLWRINCKSILNTRIHGLEWLVFKFNRKIIINIKQRKAKFNIGELMATRLV